MINRAYLINQIRTNVQNLPAPLVAWIIFLVRVRRLRRVSLFLLAFVAQVITLALTFLSVFLFAFTGAPLWMNAVAIQTGILYAIGVLYGIAVFKNQRRMYFVGA